MSWMCKKQTSVSHSSTESEIISLDAGLRLDGLPALEFWDLIVSVLGNVSRVSDRSGQPDNDVHKRHKSQKKIDVMEDIDSVPSNVQSARQEALLYVFEDNEAVIKMIIKGRSPTMRHVFRTHRVVLDWLFDRINLDSKIQIKYIDTKNQLADMLTKGNFTRDEWNHLLNLFNISHFSSSVCSAAMAKRVQQESGEERVTAKSRPMMNLTARMPTVVSSSTSPNPGKTWQLSSRLFPCKISPQICAPVIRPPVCVSPDVSVIPSVFLTGLCFSFVFVPLHFVKSFREISCRDVCLFL